jgi:hypothetical protein
VRMIQTFRIIVIGGAPQRQQGFGRRNVRADDVRVL